MSLALVACDCLLLFTVGVAVVVAFAVCLSSRSDSFVIIVSWHCFLLFACHSCTLHSYLTVCPAAGSCFVAYERAVDCFRLLQRIVPTLQLLTSTAATAATATAAAAAATAATRAMATTSTTTITTKMETRKQTCGESTHSLSHAHHRLHSTVFTAPSSMQRHTSAMTLDTCHYRSVFCAPAATQIC